MIILSSFPLKLGTTVIERKGIIFTACIHHGAMIDCLQKQQLKNSTVINRTNEVHQMMLRFRVVMRPPLPSQMKLFSSLPIV